METQIIGKSTTFAQVVELVKLSSNMENTRDHVFSVLGLFDSSITRDSVFGGKVDFIIDKVLLVEAIKAGEDVDITTKSYNDGNNIFDEYLTFTFTDKGVEVKEYNTSYMQKGSTLEQRSDRWIEAINLLMDRATIEGVNDGEAMQVVVRQVAKGKDNK